MNSTPKICSVCGKPFIPAALHMYKLTKNGKTLHQCSYTCWNKAKSTNSHDDYASRRREQG